MRGKRRCVQKFCFSKPSPRHGNNTPLCSLPAQLSMTMITSLICNYLSIFSVITSLAKLCGKGFFFFFFLLVSSITLFMKHMLQGWKGQRNRNATLPWMRLGCVRADSQKDCLYQMAPFRLSRGSVVCASSRSEDRSLIKGNLTFFLGSKKVCLLARLLLLLIIIGVL